VRREESVEGVLDDEELDVEREVHEERGGEIEEQAPQGI
jgi:hypothetical protein